MMKYLFGIHYYAPLVLYGNIIYKHPVLADRANYYAPLVLLAVFALYKQVDIE